MWKWKWSCYSCWFGLGLGFGFEDGKSEGFFVVSVTRIFFDWVRAVSSSYCHCSPCLCHYRPPYPPLAQLLQRNKKTKRVNKVSLFSNHQSKWDRGKTRKHKIETWVEVFSYFLPLSLSLCRNQTQIIELASFVGGNNLKFRRVIEVDQLNFNYIDFPTLHSYSNPNCHSEGSGSKFGIYPYKYTVGILSWRFMVIPSIKKCLKNI
jgi:hypothetical protein